MEVWKKYHEKEVSHSMAHYLQAVAGLKRDKGYARVGDIAQRLGVSKSGVTSMLRSLQSRGLVAHERYGCVELTGSGRLLANRTESNRQVLTIFFREILGVPGTTAEEDACMIEHLVSQASMGQLLRLTSLLVSGDAAAARFRQAFLDFHAPCEENRVSECEVCGDRCLCESVESGLRAQSER
ncbi:MAG: metal-dependent transcriptional regulator [bacterium]